MKLRFSMFAAALAAAFLSTTPVRAEIPAADFEKAMDTYLSKDANAEKVGGALERYLMKKQADAKRTAEEAEQKALVEQMKNPIQVDVSKSPIRGNPNAKILIVEFSDFQCPYCGRATQTVDQLLKDYPNDVKVAFKNFPLPFHNMARPAAHAALAAGRQGKFYEMHDKLFANQENLNDEAFVRFASELGLNLDKFKSDLKDPALDKQIDEDSALADKLGIQGTPGFIVGGIQVRGARPYPYFKQLIEELKKVR